MREIKFRAWHLNFLQMENDAQVLDRFAEILSRPETYQVMQYTGLKDKNDKDIYEGDILQLSDDGARSINEPNMVSVIWADDSAGFMSSNRRYLWLMTRVCDCEVIGNIYENPKLLK